MKNSSYQKSNKESYVGAPYNFVSFSDEVYTYSDGSLTGHNTIDEELFTGELDYELTAKTPIFVDGGSGEFHRDPYGNYSIPGSTMRGLIRNNVQILGLCSMADDIDGDYKLMYRNVADGSKRGKDERYSYNTVLGLGSIKVGDKEKTGALTSVKAGYITNRNGHYFIHPAEEHDVGTLHGEPYAMSYYIVSEKNVIKNIRNYPLFEAKPELLMNSMKSKFRKEEQIRGKMIDNGREIKVTFIYSPRKDESIFDYITVGEQFSFEVVRTVKNRVYINNIGAKSPTAKQGTVYVYRDKVTTQYTTISNPDFRPHCTPVSYSVNDKNYVVHIGEAGVYENNGCCLSSGYIQNKKVFYIIPHEDHEQKEFEIEKKYIESYQRDYNKRCNTIPEAKRKFYALPKPGETKAVFYVCLNGEYYFGFTPHLRLFYDYRINDGLPEQHREDVLDYSKSMFGFKAYRSKLSFSDAVAIGEIRTEGKQSRILSEPKPTSFQDYVKDGMTYNQKNFKLRGVKQYWLHENMVPAGEQLNNKVASTLKPLAKGTLFQGKIRFQNLTKEELGLLLWSVRMEKGSQMNVGKGKAYGYGRIQVKLEEVRGIDLKRAYDTTNAMSLEPYVALDANKLIDVYKESMTNFLRGKRIEELPHIQEFFAMKNIEKKPDPEKIRYMKLTDYGNRGILPSISETIGE